ncbi:hypothetical protein B0H14DRAFT_2923663 [Mycena olivaceomarginata]|nr:hypothetical protein B0H14DRAFT_2923663 [Mycena olivaceomarginata]
MTRLPPPALQLVSEEDPIAGELEWRQNESTKQWYWFLGCKACLQSLQMTNGGPAAWHTHLDSKAHERMVDLADHGSRNEAVLPLSSAPPNDHPTRDPPPALRLLPNDPMAGELQWRQSESTKQWCCLQLTSGEASWRRHLKSKRHKRRAELFTETWSSLSLDNSFPCSLPTPSGNNRSTTSPHPGGPDSPSLSSNLADAVPSSEDSDGDIERAIDTDPTARDNDVVDSLDVGTGLNINVSTVRSIADFDYLDQQFSTFRMHGSGYSLVKAALADDPTGAPGPGAAVRESHDRAQDEPRFRRGQELPKSRANLRGQKVPNPKIFGPSLQRDNQRSCDTIVRLSSPVAELQLADSEDMSGHDVGTHASHHGEPYLVGYTGYAYAEEWSISAVKAAGPSSAVQAEHIQSLAESLNGEMEHIETRASRANWLVSDVMNSAPEVRTSEGEIEEGPGNRTGSGHLPSFDTSGYTGAQKRWSWGNLTDRYISSAKSNATNRLVQSAAHTLPRGPKLLYEDLCRHDFETYVIGDSDSAIREYYDHEQKRTIYFAAAGKDLDRRVGHVVLSTPVPFQTVAVAFLNDTHDPVLTRAVWGHGRFIKNNNWTCFQSRFKTVQFPQLFSKDDLVFNLITVADDTTWLPLHHQLELTLDYNVPDQKLVNLLSPLMNTAMRNLMVEYVYAVLAVLYKLPTKARKLSYLEHQRDYINGWARVEYLVSHEAGIEIYIHSKIRVYDAYQQALERIVVLLRAISQSVHVENLYPTPEQESAARDLGSTLSLWSIEHSSCRAKYGEVNVDFYGKINPLRVALREALSPALIPNFMEPEYALYAHCTRVEIEARQLGKGKLAILPQVPGECRNYPTVL